MSPLGNPMGETVRTQLSQMFSETILQEHHISGKLENHNTESLAKPLHKLLH